MSLAQRLFLADVADVGQAGDLAHLLKAAVIALFAQKVFQLKGDVKVILNGPFASPGDDDDLLYATGHGLFHHVLDDGLVYQGEHLFGLRLGGRQQAGAQAGGGKDCFAYFHLC